VNGKTTASSRDVIIFYNDTLRPSRSKINGLTCKLNFQRRHSKIMLCTIVYKIYRMQVYAHAHQTIQCSLHPQILHGDDWVVCDMWNEYDAMYLTFTPPRRHHCSGRKAWIRALETWAYLKRIVDCLRRRQLLSRATHSRREPSFGSVRASIFPNSEQSCPICETEIMKSHHRVWPGMNWRFVSHSTVCDPVVGTHISVVISFCDCTTNLHYDLT
jgi:hypothetical protein